MDTNYGAFKYPTELLNYHGVNTLKQFLHRSNETQG
jgi:hypothetical protein